MDDRSYPWFCTEEMARLRAEAGAGIFGIAPEGRSRLKASSASDVRRFMVDVGPPACFAMFIAWPRSGHSLLGALLDAHPDMAFAHEMHVFQWFQEKFTRNEIFYFCWQNARHYGRMGRTWGSYDYTVAGGWQGRVRHLRVLGDKKGGETSLNLSRYPDNLPFLQKRMGSIPVKLVQAVRHPLDNVATMARRWRHEVYGSLDDAIDRFLRCATANERALELIGDNAITVWHEDLIEDPRRELRRLAAFFAVEAEAGWLEACAALVRPSVHRTRDAVAWTPAHLDRVRKLCDRFPFLARYCDTF